MYRCAVIRQAMRHIRSAGAYPSILAICFMVISPLFMVGCTHSGYHHTHFVEGFIVHHADLDTINEYWTLPGGVRGFVRPPFTRGDMMFPAEIWCEEDDFVCMGHEVKHLTDPKWRHE